MYYKLDENEKELIENLSSETGVNYELIGDIFPINSFISLLKDLKIELEKYKEKYEDLKENLKDNYRPLTDKELYGGYED